MATGTVAEWKFKSKNVDEAIKPDAFVSSESMVLCYIPKSDSAVAVSAWVPVGFVEQLSLQQRKNMNELWEIGSKEQFQIPGRTMRRLNINRILFDGESLMKVISNGGDDSTTPTSAATSDAPGGTTTDEMFMNLASSFFDQPMDLGLVIQDQDPTSADVGKAYGALAFENCFIESHSMNIAANQTVVMESVSLTVGKIIPQDYNDA